METCPIKLGGEKMKTIIRFGVSLLAPPFFNANLDQMGHVDIDEMGLPKNVENAVIEWNQRYQDTYCEAYPPNSGFDNNADIDAHNAEGEDLCHQIQAVLGLSYEIQFIPIKHKG